MAIALDYFKNKFNTFYIFSCVMAFVIVTIRNFNVPFAHDEVATFYYYIQCGDFLPFSSHIDANGHFLNSALAWICFKIFGSSVFALRLHCLFAFVVLCFAVYKVNNSLNNILAKLVLTFSFVVSFNIINFYSLCRGYGLSIAFLTLALFYFFDYIKTLSFSQLLKFIICAHIALSGNLTLVFTLMVTSGVLIVIQFKHKQLFTIKSIALWIINFLIILFWVKYAFYLQKNGALYYGGSDMGYMRVTFASLIETVTVKSLILNGIIAAFFLFLAGFWALQFFKQKLKFLFESRFAICFFILCALIAAFYILKKGFGVNYPEDRTGLFFYILFIFSIVYFLDEFNSQFNIVFSVIPLFFLVHFIIKFNISIHGWGFYETMPKQFFEILQAEQKKSPTTITVGGHRVLELFYSFYNYNSAEKLNHMTPPEHMTMNCDYYVTWQKDKQWYNKRYTEIATDKYWNMVLLKRKQPITRQLIYQSDKSFDLDNANEYNSIYEKLDTLLPSQNSLLAEFNISVLEAPKPFNSWLVLQVDSAQNQSAYFRRTPLNWVKFDWNNTENFTTCVLTDNIPIKKNRIAAFLWNIDQKKLHLKINSFKLYQLQGEGITEISY